MIRLAGIRFGLATISRLQGADHGPAMARFASIRVSTLLPCRVSTSIRVSAGRRSRVLDARQGRVLDGLQARHGSRCETATGSSLTAHEPCPARHTRLVAAARRTTKTVTALETATMPRQSASGGSA